MTSDKYKILGVPRLATTDEIRGAYLSLARTNHPDLNPGNVKAEADFKAIQLAYETLVDPVRRREYDIGGPANTLLYAQEFWQSPEFYWPENQSEADFRLVRRSQLSFLQGVIAALLCLAILGSAGYGVYWASNLYKPTITIGPVNRPSVIKPRRYDSQSEPNVPPMDELADTAGVQQVAPMAGKPNRTFSATISPATTVASSLAPETQHWIDSLTENTWLDQLGGEDQSGRRLDDIQVASLEADIAADTSGDDWANMDFEIPTDLNSFPAHTASIPASPPTYPEYLIPSPFVASNYPTLQELPSIAMEGVSENGGPIASIPDFPKHVSPQLPLGIAPTPLVPDMSLASQMRRGRAEIIAQSAEFFAPTPRRNLSSLNTMTPYNMSTSLPDVVLSNLLRRPASTSAGNLKKTLPQLQNSTQRSGLWGMPNSGYGTPTSNAIYSSPGMSIVPSTPTFPMPSLTPHF